MNGLDKIIAQILDDAKQESLAIREKAAGEKAMRNGFVLRRR